jgi:hypothetical protein
MLGILRETRCERVGDTILGSLVLVKEVPHDRSRGRGAVSGSPMNSADASRRKGADSVDGS